MVDDPEGLVTRGRRGTVIDGVVHDPAHAVEPKGRAGEAALPADDRRAEGVVGEA